MSGPPRAPLCTPTQVLEFGQVMQEAGLDWRAHVYGGATHAFWAELLGPVGSSNGGNTHSDLTWSGIRHHPAHTTRA